MINRGDVLLGIGIHTETNEKLRFYKEADTGYLLAVPDEPAELNDTDAHKQHTQRLFKLQTYQHYKGSTYEYIGKAININTSERLVVYRSTETKEIFARPKTMFFETVVYNGEEVKRFTKIGKDDNNGKRTRC